VEHVLDDFGEDVSDSLLDLLVDAQFDILIWVSDLSHTVMTRLLEDHAVAFLIHVKHV
jgi:hypothetical protein